MIGPRLRHHFYEGHSDTRKANTMVKPKRTAEQQVSDEADRKALNPIASRQTISEGQAEPEFRQNHKRLKAARLAREAAEPRAKTK
jgi:hypothetical protein